MVENQKYRINKFLSLCGVASRRKAEELINIGKVTINGIKAELSDTVDPKKDEVLFSGKVLTVPEQHEYFILNKPAGILSSVSDDRGRRTVADFLPQGSNAVPAGRLDIDTTGVILLMSDGELLYRLTHPKYQIEKMYEAEIKGEFNSAKSSRMVKGIMIEDIVMKAKRVVTIKSGNNIHTVKIIMTEGRKREIKELVKAVGCRVKSLSRISFGGITADGLEEGEIRKLSQKELDLLKKMTKMV
jgi:23S rRNA pseudouridine2605 synthase